ncbi:hypothetical protein EXIGLDRAFT_89793 [Exidia glandulosa HHB12029]|uniref:Uncharacterized protein n=1 Tax=Exidia glandulosa HHB12029 TaxID=1314781 RepID=A0A165NVP3_EXIGL|nr:hypothetical protein EXIGLDRAFT_89793 [Exidia glandulosa HHB12029]
MHASTTRSGLRHVPSYSSLRILICAGITSRCLSRLEHSPSWPASTSTLRTRISLRSSTSPRYSMPHSAPTTLSQLDSYRPSYSLWRNARSKSEPKYGQTPSSPRRLHVSNPSSRNSTTFGTSGRGALKRSRARMRNTTRKSQRRLRRIAALRPSAGLLLRRSLLYECVRVAPRTRGHIIVAGSVKSRIGNDTNLCADRRGTVRPGESQSPRPI